MAYVLHKQHHKTRLITLNNPDRLNALGTRLLHDFESALLDAVNDAETHAIVITGAGRSFCAGDDLKDFDWDDVNPSAVRSHIQDIQRITHLIMGCDKPVVGAVHGYAVGGGFEWLLNCDLVVAAKDLIAFFPELKWGFFVTGGVTYLLPKSIGHQKSMELFLLGERQNADALYRLGLVNWIVEEGGHVEKALEVANRIAESASRPAVAQLKKTINCELGQGLWHAIQMEQNATIDAFLRPETKEIARTFLSKEK